MFKYLGKLIENNTGHSSKSFGLVLSAIVGALMGLAVVFALIWDVSVDGIINTDLSELGVFVLCIGAYTFGSGANKMLSEIGESKSAIKELTAKDKDEEDEE